MMTLTLVPDSSGRQIRRKSPGIIRLRFERYEPEPDEKDPPRVKNLLLLRMDLITLWRATFDLSVREIYGPADIASRSPGRLSARERYLGRWEN